MIKDSTASAVVLYVDFDVRTVLKSFVNYFITYFLRHDLIFDSFLLRILPND